MLTRRLALAVFAAIFAVTAGSVSSRAANTETAAEAAALVEQLAARSLAVLERSDLSGTERRAMLAETLNRGLDIPQIARAVLGKAGRQASDTTRQQFEAIFAAYLIDSVARKLKDQTDGNLILLGAAHQNTGEVLVESRLHAANGHQIRAVWRVRDQGQGPKVVDIAVEGISLVLTQRQEFAAVIKRQGLEGLLTLLKGKVQTAAAP